MPRTSDSDKEAFRVRLGDRGRLVVPARLRKWLGVRPGDRLLFRVREDGVATVESAVRAARSLRGAYTHVAPGRDLASELIAERREDAERE